MFQSLLVGRFFRSSFALVLIAIAHAATAATNIVTTAADDNSPGSLRYLIANSATNDTIVFAPGLSGATILLTNYALVLNKNLNIDASALPAGIQLNGNHQSTVIIVSQIYPVGITNVLTGLTITNGYAPPYGPGNYVGDGGGVLNYGTLTLNRCTVAGNISAPLAVNHFFPPWGHGGGGIANGGSLTMNQCTVTGNIVTNGVGDGIYNDGTLVMNACTLSGNAISVGFYCPNYCGPSGAHTTLNQCTISGGGIGYYAVNRVIIYQSTLVNAGQFSSNSFAISNSIIVASGYPSNTIPDGANTVYTANGNLSPLGYYGGFTQTMPPLPSSPAIDNGNDNATNYFATDQRGSPRLANLHVDCGAVETAVTPAAPLASTLPVTGLGLTTATLNASINQNSASTTCYFQYGITTNYGAVTPIIPLNTSIAVISNTLTGLAQGTLYHYRIVATNIAGTAVGADLTFQTGVPRIVSNTNDSGSGSLRDVVASFSIGDTITIASNLSGQTILLTSGQITLSNSFTLDASTLPAGLTIDGHTNGRIFTVTNNATVLLDSLTITNGKSLSDGGGIYNQGNLTLNRCTVSGHRTSADGGGIRNLGTLTLNQCLVGGNTAAANGGGILNSGTLTINSSTISGNSSSSPGGGIFLNSGTLTLNQSTVSGNSSVISGGGIYSGGSVTINQSTLSGNTAGSGGGIYNGGSLTLKQSTIAGNYATSQGGGIANQTFQAWSLFNCVVAGNSNLNIVTISGNAPLTASGGNLTAGNPMLAPLGDYGGPTQTMPPLVGSPLVDNGADTATNSFPTDQRGSPRLANLHVDIGAVELVVSPAAPLALTQPATAIDATVATVNGTVTPNGAVTTYYFLYGTNVSYSAFSTPLTLNAGVAAVSCTLTGLLPATTYHFRLAATNSQGIASSDDLTFQTRNSIHIVSNTNDSGPGSLRDAAANFFAGDTMILSNNLAGKKIVLTSGQITLSNSLSMDASTLAGGLTIDGNTNGRIFQVGSGATAVFNSLTITNGKTSDVGGGLYVQGALTLNQCTIAGNAASSGGGICNAGTLTLNTCSVAGNSASTNGGGIYNGGSLVLNQSTVSGNSAGNYGGGFYGHVILKQSTVSGNTANIGGGIYDPSSYTYNFQAAAFQSTVSANYATNTGGGMYFDGFSGSLTLSNSIIAGNSSPTYPDLRYFDDQITFYFDYLGANLTNGNPLLSPLGNYGGPTLTMPPTADSPAIDGCNKGTSFATDQRGFPRLSGLYADLGAAESSFPPAIPLAVTLPAVVLDSTTAILNARFVPHGAPASCYLLYGTNTAYSAFTTPATFSAGVSSSITVTGLLPRTTYHFRAVAINNLGRGDGDDLTFLTGGFTDLVSTTNDNGPGSLRDIVANHMPGNPILFDPNLSGKTIWLTNGPIFLAQSLTIDASPLPARIAIDGNQHGRVFQVTNNTNVVVVLDSLTIKNGKAIDYGGGVYNAGNLTLNRCTVTGNSASSYGGGIFNAFGAILTVSTSTVTGNTASTNGGGICNIGALSLSQSTLSSNSAAISGGGLYNFGGTAFSLLTQSTFSGNTAKTGGGIYLDYGLLMDQCTISANYATNGGGGFYNNSQLPRVTNSIFTGNFGPVSPDILWLGQTLVLAQWSANLTNGNPMLAPLGNYGGPTQTMPPLPGSPAIDACTGGTRFTTDQRGFPRPVDGNGDSIALADIGAVEGFAYPDGPGLLTGTKKLGNGAIQFGFPNYTGGSYTVFATTNFADPLNTWSNLGPALETPPGSGQYQFTDPGATNNPQRFYRVRSP